MPIVFSLAVSDVFPVDASGVHNWMVGINAGDAPWNMEIGYQLGFEYMGEGVLRLGTVNSN